jgi:hypothetical protein
MKYIDEEAFGTLQIVLVSKRLLAAGCSLIKSVFSRVCSQERVCVQHRCPSSERASWRGYFELVAGGALPLLGSLAHSLLFSSCALLCMS